MKNSERKNNIIGLIKILILLVLIGCMLCYLSEVFTYKGDNGQNNIKSFYKEKKNSLDGIYIGSSAVYRYWIPTMAYERHGMCIYGFTSPAQPMCTTKYLVKEALKTQSDAKYIIIELRNIVKDDTLVQESAIRRTVDSMKDSKNRRDAIDKSLKFYKDLGLKIDYNKNNYYYKLMKYHGMWDGSITVNDLLLKSGKSKYKGFVLSKDSFKTVPFPYPLTYPGKLKIDKNREEILRDLLKYCKGLKQKVIFVSSPGYSARADKRMKMNYVMDICQKEGFTAVNFNQEPWKSRINMDWSNDYYEVNHTNIKGAIKYTKYFSDLLKKAYGEKLDDHRGDKKYKSWDEAAELLKNDIKKMTKK